MVPFLPNLPALWDMFYLPPPTPFPNLLYSTVSTRRLAFMENTNRFPLPSSLVGFGHWRHCQEIEEWENNQPRLFISLRCSLLSSLTKGWWSPGCLSSSPSSADPQDYLSTFHFTPESAKTFLWSLTSPRSGVFQNLPLVLVNSFTSF